MKSIKDSLFRLRGEDSHKFTQLLFFSKELGVKIDIDSERTYLGDYLRRSRSRCDGFYLATAIYHLGRLGLQVEATDEDRNVMKGHIESDTPYKIGDHALAEMYFYLRNIMPKDEATQNALPLMPPLRRFSIL